MDSILKVPKQPLYQRFMRDVGGDFSMCPGTYNQAVDSIKEDMMKTEWYEKLQLLTCNDGFNLLHKHLTDSLDKHAPEKEYASTKVRKHLPWFTLGLKKNSTKLKQFY